MNILGRFVTLRAMTMDDMQMICDMFNDVELESKVVGWAYPLSLEQQVAWYQGHMNDSNMHRFVIETPEDGAVGIMVFGDIDWKNRCATCGIKLANKQFRGKGIGTDATMAILRYAFDELGMHRMESTALFDNEPSRKTYTKCGFRIEGVKRECVYKAGKYHDLNIIAVLEDEYRECAKNMKYWD